MSGMRIKLGAVAAVVLIGLAVGIFAQGQPAAQSQLSQDPACQSLTPGATGGPMPKDPNIAVVRWLGHSNYEVDYRDTVILGDAYYDRPPRSHPIGVMPKDFKKVDAILVGHAHSDHISDAATVAKQTGAMVVGAFMGEVVVNDNGLPSTQWKTVKGGESLEFKNILVQTVLAHHNVISTTVPAGYLDKVSAALNVAALATPLNAEEQKLAAAISARGSRDARISDRGTIGYMLSLGPSFKIWLVDSPGPITDGEREIMKAVPGGVDVAFLSLVSRTAGIPPLVELTKTFQPKYLLVGHHDGPGTLRWPSLFPAGIALRKAVPKAQLLEVPYRTPVCFNVNTKEMFIGL